MHIESTALQFEDIGRGWDRATARLAKGDTAWNPASTKGSIYGPCLLTYWRGPSGAVTVQVDD